jgi:hypothetical protein
MSTGLQEAGRRMRRGGGALFLCAAAATAAAASANASIEIPSAANCENIRQVDGDPALPGADGVDPFTQPEFARLWVTPSQAPARWSSSAATLARDCLVAPA